MWGYIMIAPTFIGLLVLNIIPVIDNIFFEFPTGWNFWKWNSL